MLRRAAFLLLMSLSACSFVEDAGGSSSEVNEGGEHRGTLSFPDDPFIVNAGTSEPRWVKLSILTSEPGRVYFQDSNKLPFHLDFARKHLPGFAGTSPGDFARASLKAEGQRVIVGAVLMPPRGDVMEYGIQLLREDEYSREDVKRLHDLVKSKINVAEGRRATVFYMPSYEQAAAAERERGWLAENGVVIGSPARWLAGDACYSDGWAFGRAKFVPGSEIKRAHLEGRLKPEDILVTDGVPAEVPFVAGIVALAPSTPSSHVAILSKTWGIPFVYPQSESERARVRALEGKEIALRTTAASDVFGQATCKLDVIEPKGEIDAQTRADIAALRRPAPVTIPKKTRLGALTKPSVELGPADAKYFGGKASNFGTLRRTIPASSPNALGVSFDLWDAFVAQTLPAGKTLREEIDARIGGLTFPPDIPALEAKLVQLREMIEDDAALPPALRTQLFADLRAFGFDPKVKIRFRSSTNVEDGETLSGAGLYDSFSGCLADDLDADTAGPSLCDPGEAKERGVERAIKKVFASFFNTNAVLERIKYGIDEDDVGMALAVHLSFPDEREAANGVATVKLDSFSTTMELVTQLGAESVTNPEPGALPETVTAQIYDFGDGPSEPSVVFGQGSTRVALGAKVMTWEKDYVDLAQLIAKASAAFKKDHAVAANAELALDIEYKKDTDGSLWLKQIRAIPQRSNVPSLVPVLLNEGAELCTFQGEAGNVLGNHRLKTRGRLDTKNVRLAPETIARASVVAKLAWGPFGEGDPSTFAGSSHAVTDRVIADTWTAPFGTLTLANTARRLVAPSETPLVVARDFGWHFEAKYTTPRAGFLGAGEIVTVRSDEAWVSECVADDQVAPDTKELRVAGPRGLEVTTRYRYRKAIGPFEKTASLGRWESTEIRGLTSAPIVLRGYFSQTFRPGHHNFDEDFAFEPALEEGLPAAQAAELEAKDIQTIFLLNAAAGSGRFYVLRKSTQQIEAL
ncbi:MAG: hypothetical protein KIT84_14020 [Labilithrix sp.]|nr:hypothetical protein [Labilithrix sp.]MCW5812137.1 hypothetical protein [Labilithrix sp.]